MAKEIKYLYETVVKKQVKEKVTEERQENGSKVEVSKDVNKVKLVKVALLKPNRRLYEQAEIFYAKTIAEFIKAGLLPYSLVAKRYANDGGPLSEPEIKNLEKLKAESNTLEKEFFEIAPLTTPEASSKKKEILLKLNKANQEANTIQNAYADIFENTAEVKARNRVIEWWALNLSLINEDEKGYKQLFGEGTHDEKLVKYDDFEENEDQFYIDIIRRLAYLTSFWFAARHTLSAVDFQGMEKVYEETVSTYKVEEEKEPEFPKNIVTIE